VAERAATVGWRATPRVATLAPEQLEAVARAARAVESDAAALEERLGVSLRTQNPLGEVLQRLARELVVQRTLLLVPALVLLLLGAAATLLVASAVSDARRGEEGLFRSRGAGRTQLVGPTVVEATLLCLVAAALGPLLAFGILRVGEVRPELEPGAWVASAGAALVCGLALVLPTVARSFGGDSGEQLSESRRRRRRLTGLLAVTVLVVALGLAALVTLRGFAGRSAAGTGWDLRVDPLVVAAPALLLLAVVALTALTLLPATFRLAARAVRGRGVALALGMRFASRAPSRTVPFALVVALAAAATSFAVVEHAGQERARQARAAYQVGADVRVVTPPVARRAGEQAERRALTGLPAVRAIAPVSRELDYVDDVAVEVLVADLSGDAVGRALLSAAEDPDAVLERLRPPGAPGSATPVVITDALAERAALRVGDPIELPIGDGLRPLRVAAVVPFLPTVADDRTGLLLPAVSLPPGTPGAGPGPDEWWLEVAEGRAGAVASRLAERTELAARVLTRGQAQRALAGTPRTGGAAFDEILTVTATGALVIGGVLLFSVILLRRRERAEQASLLRTLGATNRDVTRTLGVEYALTSGVGAVAGVAGGVLVAAVVLGAMTLGPGGGPLVPRPEVVLPWGWLLVTPAAFVLVPLAALLVLARHDRDGRRRRRGGGRR
jgi:hypothetical protein